VCVCVFISGFQQINKHLISYSGMQVDTKDANNRQPLHWAADFGQVEVLKFLVSKGILLIIYLSFYVWYLLLIHSFIYLFINNYLLLIIIIILCLVYLFIYLLVIIIIILCLVYCLISFLIVYLFHII